MLNEINYSIIIDDALHYAVKKVLKITEKHGLIGNHHFFISFMTNYPGVELSDEIRERYPGEITVVLQHQFEDLVVTDEDFSVKLSFNGIKERIVVPFASLTAFADPSVKFGLQFKYIDENYQEAEKKLAKNKKSSKKASEKEDESLQYKNQANVIDINSLRKKKK